MSNKRWEREKERVNDDTSMEVLMDGGDHIKIGYQDKVFDVLRTEYYPMDPLIILMDGSEVNISPANWYPHQSLPSLIVQLTVDNADYK